jgi:uncharacterized protein YecE (DUF72 family)
MALVWVGTSGFSYESWRGILYPEDLPTRRWLEHYAQEFPTVELNSTFYHMPRPVTVEGWRQRVPEGFRYAVKASRFITHVKKLEDIAEPLARFYEVVARFDDRLGPILFQLPPSLHRDDALLRKFLRTLSREFLTVVEFRHASWFCDPVYEALDAAGVAICSVSSPKLRTGVLRTGPIVYLRFHGEERMFVSRYSVERLREWARETRDVLRRTGPCPVFAYFNNDVEGHAVLNARELRQVFRRLGLREPDWKGREGE